MHNTLDVLEGYITHLQPAPHKSKALKLFNVGAGPCEKLVPLWEAHSGSNLHSLHVVKGVVPRGGDDHHSQDCLGVLVRGYREFSKEGDLPDV